MFNEFLSALNLFLAGVNAYFAYRAYQDGNTKSFAISGGIALVCFAAVLL